MPKDRFVYISVDLSDLVSTINGVNTHQATLHKSHNLKQKATAPRNYESNPDTTPTGIGYCLRNRQIIPQTIVRNRFYTVKKSCQIELYN